MNRTSQKRGFNALKVGSIWLFLLLLMAALSLVAVSVGSAGYSLGEILRAVFSGEESTIKVIIFNLRLPRLLLAILVGAGLSVAGCVFQSLFANPLATPDTLGVASGASCGAALALLLGFGLTGLQLMATVFGIGAVGLTWLAASGKSGGRSRIVLAGIMIGSLFSALISLLKYVADPESQLPAITYWLMGSFDSASYGTLALGALPIVLGSGILLSIVLSSGLLVKGESQLHILARAVYGHGDGIPRPVAVFHCGEL